MPIAFSLQKKIILLYQQGSSLAQVASTLHISSTTVIYYLKQHGVPRRSRSEAVTA
jgi:orotate phosphoribosyltransferase-like protein